MLVLVTVRLLTVLYCSLAIYFVCLYVLFLCMCQVIKTNNNNNNNNIKIYKNIQFSLSVHFHSTNIIRTFIIHTHIHTHARTSFVHLFYIYKLSY